MPTTKPALVTCTCKHHKSAHEYVPRDDGLGGPPQHCVVPGCTCKLFVSRYSARAAREEARFEEYLKREREAYHGRGK